ncbi:MAG TPA: F0F1 ATP synthase subunit B [Chitinophagaceae bacterium]|jgi:F-type H+-transporting ATPase subunit b|nr:F0F1 ATP synthase subunit B [Chitinophagaceae bacterium]
MDLLSPDFGLIFWMVVIFLLTFLILAKYAWKPILKMLEAREKSIAESIESADRIKAEMSQMKSEHEQMLVEARAERSRMLKDAKETQEQIIAAAKERAKTEARKIVEDAQIAINNQKMAALTDVKNQVGNLALEVAEKILRKELANKETHQHFIRQLAEEIKLN